MSAPLTGVKVLELGMNFAGPFAGQVLALMGADVVKVERPEGDDARTWGPPFWRGTSPAYLAVNNNKRSVTLDLREPAAREWLLDHVEGVDVVIHNFRPGALEELGLGAEALQARNPRLVFCAVSAFGAAGPKAKHPGYEPIVQAFAGLMSVNGDEGGPATRMGTSILDFGTGMWAAMGVLAGLVQRQATGRGCVVDASLYETALAWLTGHAASFQVSGELPVRHRTGSTRLVVFQSFDTKDGEIVIAAGNDRLFAKLARAIGRPEWAADPRFATNALRVQHRSELIPEIEAIMRTGTREEWAARLDDAGVPCAPIHDLREVLAHPQTEALGMLQEAAGLRLVGLPLSFDGERPPIRSAAPALGEHNAITGGASAPPGAPAVSAPRPSARVDTGAAAPR